MDPRIEEANPAGEQVGNTVASGGDPSGGAHINSMDDDLGGNATRHRVSLACSAAQGGDYHPAPGGPPEPPPNQQAGGVGAMVHGTALGPGPDAAGSEEGASVTAGGAVPKVEQLPPHLAAVKDLEGRMLAATCMGVDALRETVLSSEEVVKIMERGAAALKNEPTLIELELTRPDVKVVMVGDLHGQFHDVCIMLAMVGYPSEERVFVFNGDFVDRGSWGLETLILLVSLKLAMPKHIYLIRGNHESTTCTTFYGFKGEVDAKYKGPSAKVVFQSCKKLFAMLPLAAVVQKATLILHGGLFRHRVVAPLKKGVKRGRRKMVLSSVEDEISLGSLEDLRSASKGGMDPDGLGSSLIATDILWSDPVSKAGLNNNEARGVGLTFGPDITQTFLEENQLKLVLRSHEGPDARDRCTGMPNVMEGFSVDHETAAGRLMTIFSAPDYPQFQNSSDRYNNKGAVVVLSAPDYATPLVCTFQAVQPRPNAVAYYDYETYADTDEEIMGDEASMGGSSACSSLLSADDQVHSEVQSGVKQAGDQVQSGVKQAEECEISTTGTTGTTGTSPMHFPPDPDLHKDVQHMVGTEASKAKIVVRALESTNRASARSLVGEGGVRGESAETKGGVSAGASADAGDIAGASADAGASAGDIAGASADASASADAIAGASADAGASAGDMAGASAIVGASADAIAGAGASAGVDAGASADAIVVASAGVHAGARAKDEAGDEVLGLASLTTDFGHGPNGDEGKPLGATASDPALSPTPAPAATATPALAPAPTPAVATVPDPTPSPAATATPCPSPVPTLAPALASAPTPAATAAPCPSPAPTLAPCSIAAMREDAPLGMDAPLGSSGRDDERMEDETDGKGASADPLDPRTTSASIPGGVGLVPGAGPQGSAVAELQPMDHDGRDHVVAESVAHVSESDELVAENCSTVPATSRSASLTGSTTPATCSTAPASGECAPMVPPTAPPVSTDSSEAVHVTKKPKLDSSLTKAPSSLTMAPSSSTKAPSSSTVAPSSLGQPHKNISKAAVAQPPRWR